MADEERDPDYCYTHKEVEQPQPAPPKEEGK